MLCIPHGRQVSSLRWKLSRISWPRSADLLSKSLTRFDSGRGPACEICGISLSSRNRHQGKFTWTLPHRETDLGTSLSGFGKVSSIEYYLQVISLCACEWIRTTLIEGLVTSASAGSESILCSSRVALVAYLEGLEESKLAAFWQCFVGVLRNNISNERLVVSILDVLGFLLETGIFQQLDEKDLRFVIPPGT